MENKKVKEAIKLFENKEVSLSRAAELAGKSLNDFIEILKESNIPWAEYTEEQFVEDQLAIKKYLKLD